jgi:hypothetical protein
MRRELVAAASRRYSDANRQERGRILDELTSLTGSRRKHAARLLRGNSVTGSDKLTLIGKMKLTHQAKWFLRRGETDAEVGGSDGVGSFAGSSATEAGASAKLAA